MNDLQQIEHEILAQGKVTGVALDALRRIANAGGKMGRPTADSLVELYKRVQHRSPAFEHFFYDAIKNHILADGRIDPEETAWLRRLLLSGGPVSDEGRKFLHVVRGEAEQVAPQFEALFQECMKQAPEQLTCG